MDEDDGKVSIQFNSNGRCRIKVSI